MHLVSDYISVFDNGGDAWKKITVRVDSFSTKASLIPLSYQRKSEYWGQTSFCSNLCVCGKINECSLCGMI